MTSPMISTVQQNTIIVIVIKPFHSLFLSVFVFLASLVLRQPCHHDPVIFGLHPSHSTAALMPTLTPVLLVLRKAMSSVSVPRTL